MYGYIYKTTNLINNKIYIGQHKAQKFSLNYKGSGKMLREAFSKYGKENFSVVLVEECSTQEDMDSKEMYWISYYNSTNTDIGYNISIGGIYNTFTGRQHNESTKQKMRDAKLGIEFSQEHKENISKGKKGHIYSEERNFKISKTLKERDVHVSHKGHSMSEEAKQKIRDWHLKKGKLSEETKKKMSEVRTGKKYKKNN